jgi:hypothetical protein
MDETKNNDYLKDAMPPIGERIKHLRGRHDQRDHAWNRGMGRNAGGGGGLAPGFMTEEDYRALTRRLDTAVAEGKMTQAENDALRAEVRRLHREDADRMEREAQPQGQSRREEISQALVEERTNANQRTGFLNSLSNPPIQSRDFTPWYSYFSGFIPQGRENDIDLVTGKWNRTSDPNISRYLDKPEQLRTSALVIASRGTQNLPPSVTYGESTVTELDTSSGAHLLPQQAQAWRTFAAEMGIDTWSLDQDTADDETVKGVVEESARIIQEQIQLSADIMSDTVLYEQMFVEAEQSEIANRLRALESAKPVIEKERRKISDEYAKSGRSVYLDERLNAAQLEEVYQDNPELRSLMEDYKFIEDMSFKVFSLDSFLRDIQVNETMAMRQLQQNIMAKLPQLVALSSGVPQITPQLQAFFNTQMGRAINPDMQTAAYAPAVKISDSFRQLAEDAGVDIQAQLNNVFSFMSQYVDARLHPSAQILLDDKPEDNEPETQYDPFTDRVVIPMVESMAPGALLHELGHAISDMYPEVNDIMNQFYQSRLQADSRILSSRTSRWAPDNFPDWYCGLTGNGKEQIEILSMGISMLFTDPVRFAREQPDYYRMVTTVLSGKWMDKATATPTTTQQVETQTLANARRGGDVARAYENVQARFGNIMDRIRGLETTEDAAPIAEANTNSTGVRTNPDALFGKPKISMEDYPLYSRLQSMSDQQILAAYKSQMTDVRIQATVARQQSVELNKAEAQWLRTFSSADKREYDEKKKQYDQTVDRLAKGIEDAMYMTRYRQVPYLTRGKNIMASVKSKNERIADLQKEEEQMSRLPQSSLTRNNIARIQVEITKIKQEVLSESAELADLEATLATMGQRAAIFSLTTALRHPNPLNVDIAQLSPEMTAELSRSDSIISNSERFDLMRATLQMFPRGNRGDKGRTKISLTKEPRANCDTKWDGRKKEYTVIVGCNALTMPNTFMHEALHAAQVIYPELQMRLDEWATIRANADPNGKRTLNDIEGRTDPNKMYKPNEVGYEDAVDDPYTLKFYNSSNGNFLEVITMGLDSLQNVWNRNDKDLLRTVLGGIMRLE